ncbi:agamous-like MADS-box protein AGL75 [Mangifera indica]|uniref:agamous-like MADS-box protein AGL75 n=1 Tax=Mangifera indica TaxID=29780 RepID=UPI001CF9DE87|nr:agamous-like MADS-box protein AGL75 [Mangifera indica]
MFLTLILSYSCSILLISMAPSTSQKFNRRKSTLKNKAQQLQTLSDVMVCMVCFGNDGEVTTWPEDKPQVHQTIIKYKLARFRDRSKEKLNNPKCNLNLLGFLASKKRKLQKSKKRNPQKKKKKKDIENLFLKWETKLNMLQEKELVALCNCLELKLRDSREQIKQVRMKEKEKGKAIQIYNNNGDCNLESQQEVLASPSEFCSRSDALWGGNSEIFFLPGENCDGNYVGNCYDDLLLGDGTEKIRNTNNILNPCESMAGYTVTTQLHEASWGV